MTTKTNRHWSASLARIGACKEAVRWAKERPSLQAAWDSCQRGDWLLWYACRVSGGPESESRRRVVLAACDCAELALPTYERRYPGDNRPRRAIETARRWARGEAGITLSDVHAAAASASAASDSAASACAAASDSAAAYAAYAAADSAYAAAASASAASASDSAAAYAAYAADADAARTKKLAECADIVRRHFPIAPSLKGGAS